MRFRDFRGRGVAKDALALEKPRLANMARLLQFLLERNLMLNLNQVVRQLKQEQEQVRMRLEQLDAALKALSGVGGLNRGSVRTEPIAGKRRLMSAAARKRIAAAQRARWAKWKAAQKKKQ